MVVRTGPDPAWAEVGYWALRRAIVQLASLPETGGGQRDWVAARLGERARARVADRSSSAATSSSGSQAAAARCQASRSASETVSETSASAACTRRRSSGDAEW